MIRAFFKPLPDITAYELAVIMKNTVGFSNLHDIIFGGKSWEELSPDIKRHFEIKEGDPSYG